MNKLDQEVLKLNKNWQVIGTITVRKAFSDAYSGQVTMLRYVEGYPTPYRLEDWLQLEPHEGDEFVGVGQNRVTGETNHVIIPRVVITVKFDKLIVKPPKLTMKNLRKRDGDTCQLTKKKLKPSEMSMEHVVPESKGGRKVWTNIVLAHKEINSMRGNRDYHEVGLEMPKAVAPRGRKPSEIIEPLYPEWTMFLVKQSRN